MSHRWYQSRLQARLELVETLPFIERHIRRSTEASTRLVDARQLISDAGVALQEQIDLEEPHRQALQVDLDKLLEQVVRRS